MTRFCKLSVGTAVLVLCVTAASTAEAKPEKIAACTTITEPGSYVVTKNLTAAGDCIVIDTSNVELNLGGFTISGNGTGSGVVDTTTVDLEDIDVRNGTVTGFDVGIDLSALRTSIRGVRAINNVDDGIRAGFAVISGNIAFENGGIGIRASGSSIVSDNLSHSNGDHGIRAGSSVVTRNVTRSNGGDGIHGLPGSGGVYAQNASSLNTGSGINVTGSVVRENGATSNFVSGISAGCPSSVVGNTVLSNVAAKIVTSGVGCVLADNATN